MSKKKTQQGQWTKCEQCGKEIRPGYVATHNRKAHSDEPFISKIAARKAKSEKTKGKRKTLIPCQPGIHITSKRGTVIRGKYRCWFCHHWFNEGWRYKSNHGPIDICGPCKSINIVAPYGIGMPRPREVVTNFETNRKRH